MSEQLRQERWHEVYMTVLKAQLQPSGSYQTMAFNCGGYAAIDPEGAHTRAKSVADKAYPAPAVPVRVDDIRGLQLSVRAENALRFAGITSREQAAAMSDAELLRLPHMGRKALKDIREALARPV